MAVALADRLVEVIAHTGTGYRYGSGCIVAGRTVLTAAHVVAGCVHVQVRTSRKVLQAATIDVRFVGDDGGPGPDLALVEIDDPSIDLPALVLARIDRESVTEAAIECHAMGYPWFAKQPSPTTVRDVVDAVGTIPVLSKLATGLASIHVRNEPRILASEGQGLPDSVWQGMSGGPVISGGRLVGVVIEHASREGQSTITVAPITLLERHPHYPHWGPGVDGAHAWWRRLGVAGPADLAVLPAAGGSVPARSEVELSPDAVQRYRATLQSSGITLPPRCTAAALSTIAVENPATRVGELVSALRRSSEAKRVLVDIGIDQLGLAQLHVIYRREVGSWPVSDYADGLLIQAAEVEGSERRTGMAGDLGALARFVIGVAVARSISPRGHPGLAEWIASLGYQVADAESRFQDRVGARAWLLLDLGAEPQTGMRTQAERTATPWPTRITWTLVTRHGSTTGEHTATPTRDGVAEALISILATLPPVQELLVDLAVPADLLESGIEHWPLFPDSLTERHRARLRWSQRLHDIRLRGKCIDRISRTNWTAIPTARTDSVLADRSRLDHWIRNDTVYAWLVGRRPATSRSDPLRVLLKAGYGFLVWLPEDADLQVRRAITRAVKQIPVAARRAAIPDELPTSSEPHMVIWDDPRGREDEFALPPPTAAEPIPLQSL